MSACSYPTRSRQVVIVAALSSAFGAAAFLYDGVAAKSFSFSVFLASVGFFAMSMALGAAVVAVIAPHRPEVDAIEALLAGVLLVAASLMGFAFILPTGIVTNAVLIVGVAAVLYARWSRQVSPSLVLDRYGAIAIAAMIVASGLWSFENLQGLIATPSGFISYPWVDVFFHAQRIALFARSSGPQTLVDPAAAGVPLPPYHYASYLPPAFVSAATGADAYSLAAGVLPTLGTQLTGLAAYALGRTCFGQVGGLLGALGVLLIPDPSFVRLSSRYTSYHFYQQVGPGGSYAVAAMGLAWVWAYRAVQDRRIPYAIAAVVCCGLAALFKIQIVLVYALGLLLFVCGALRTTRWRVACAAAVLVAYATAVFAASYVQHSPTLELSTTGLHEILSLLTSRFPSEHARWWFLLLPQDSSYSRELIVGVPLIFFCVYGAVLIAAVLSLVTMPQILSLPLWLPAIALSSHLLVMTTIAPNRGPHGDPIEIILKTLVWPYFLLAAWASAALGARLGQSSLWTSRASRLVGLIAGLAMFGLVARCGRQVQWGMAEDPRFVSHSFMRTPLPSGLVAAARYLRKYAAPHDVVQWSENDGLLAFSALSERPPYLARAMINTGPMSPEGERRLQEFQALWYAPNTAAASVVATRLGIDWFVISNLHAAWEDDPAAIPTFVADGYRVYRMAQLVPDSRGTGSVPGG